jgi:hypothetical protein
MLLFELALTKDDLPVFVSLLLYVLECQLRLADPKDAPYCSPGGTDSRA